jgi:hypothetical protein
MKWNNNFDTTYPIEIVDASYGPLTKGGFGSKMKVVLGPGAAMMRTGSSTSAGSLPSIMPSLVKKDGPKAWVAARLLNAELGGSGTDSTNLAPLTGTANKQHSAYELKVKSMCIVARQKLNLEKKPSKPLTFLYGVKYSVQTVDTFGDFSPYDKVPSHFLISAHVCKYDLDGSNERALDPREQRWFASYCFTNIRIDNQDAHIGY